ncbi:RNA-directed DNA polymerase, eukaryota, Reverse transcriptase zinc-binding domain protein [Artemisia annua]|uniref:RNA-directed DNA polymerase, eukaryota, Reverse transcriptase zinc-binding domain protein n=1 Tax=Artemisia annua TaxID=35608 RepID=A0A2U1PUC9_ARTAN|nr:RNA-directed DNA polymerase, eukaryota, Reverse transcriptase zinc-binding domain protein [Artemisia annua]
MWCLMVLGLGPWHGMICSQNGVNVPLLLNEQDDTLLWKLHDGILKSFSVRDVYQTVRDRGEEVELPYLVWSCYWIPCHAIHLWLVMRRRLKPACVHHARLNTILTITCFLNVAIG